MGIYLNPGSGLFERAIHSEIYVDKTNLIKHVNNLIGTEQCYVCISRPRRFGKSMAANMLTAYYSRGYDASELFESFSIAQGKDSDDIEKQKEYAMYRKHMNQYDVLAINVQSFISLFHDVVKALDYMQKKILKELRLEYPEVLDEDETFLSIGLEEVYSKTNRQFVFVIDEWDCILRDVSYSLEDQKIYLDFIRNLLKDKAYVGLAYMTGILPIKKYGTHSALNMFSEYSMMNPGEYAECAGFTEKEVKELCVRYNMDYDKMQLWYDGYCLPEVGHIYNPKSVVEAILTKQFSNYWTKTETYEALKIYLEMNYDGLKDSILRMIAGDRVAIITRSFQNDMSTFKSKDDVLALLVHLGYLAFDQNTSEVFIPNKEILEEFDIAVRCGEWKEVIQTLENSERLLEATWKKDAETVAKCIDISHSENTSILNYNDENALSFVVSLAYFSAANYYMRIREFPSGKGFADIVYIPKPRMEYPA
jgi:hypothetical protein